MALIGLTSFSGAPGVTTLAVAWAMTSPRPTLILELDLTGGSPILAGVFDGTRRHDRSVLALADSDGTRFEDLLWEQAISLPEHDQAWVVPTIAWPVQAASLARSWRPLAAAAAAISDRGGMDVLVDLGRMRPDSPHWPLIQACEAVLVITGASLPMLNATVIGLQSLTGPMDTTVATSRTAVVPVHSATGSGPARYSTREITHICEPTPVLGPITWAPRDAAVYSSAARPTFRHSQSRYLASVKTLIGQTEHHIRHVNHLLDPELSS